MVSQDNLRLFVLTYEIFGMDKLNRDRYYSDSSSSSSRYLVVLLTKHDILQLFGIFQDTNTFYTEHFWDWINTDFKWKESVDSAGNVFYFEALPIKESTVSLREEKEPGLLGRLIRRRNSVRIRKKPEKEDKIQPLIHVNVIKYKDVSLNLGRRGSITEQNLGLKTTFDKGRIVISGILEDSPFIYKPKIIIGDILVLVNDNVVTTQNLDAVVYECQTETILAVERQEDKYVKCNNLIPIHDEEFESDKMGVIFSKFKNLNEEITDDVLYLYPKTSNILIPIKGVFFTIHHLLSSITSKPPLSTSIKIKDDTIHIMYNCEKDKLFLFALPNLRYTLEESLKITQEVVQYQKYISQSLSRWYETDNFSHVDEYYRRFFKNILTSIENNTNLREFETILLSSPFLSVPRDVYLQIDDALNELESNDFLVKENTRNFTIIGSAYICKGKVICSHMSNEDLIEVVTTFNQSGLMKMSENGVKDLLYWREVFPVKYMRGLLSYSSSLYSVPVGQWFLLVVAQGNNFLAVLLESGGCTERLVYKGPDEAYIDEAQATLDHIINLGIPRIISKWTGKLCEEETKNFDQKSMSGSGIIPNLSVSELSLKSDYYEPETEGKSEMPVLGRRAEREMAENIRTRISTSDISDDSDFLKDSRTSDYSSEIDLSKNRPEIAEKPKSQFILYYVDLNITEGIIVSSPNFNTNLKKYQNVMDNFRKYSHKIKKMFMNTISFKKLKSKELQRYVWNKSLVAIKEFGMLFTTSDKKCSYWVVGRLFSTPILREVYVCYQDICPQNLVEMAFNLSLSSP